MRTKLLTLAAMMPLVGALSACGDDILDHWHLRDPRGLTKVRFLNGQFVGVGTNGTIITSPDGRAWTARNSGTTSDLRSVTWGQAPFPDGPAFVAVGKAGTISEIVGRGELDISDYPLSPLGPERCDIWRSRRFHC